MKSETIFKRTLRLKNNLLSSPYEICLERIKSFTEIYKKNKDDPDIIKKAKAIAHLLRTMTIFIRDDELLVGNETSKNLAEKMIYLGTNPSQMKLFSSRAYLRAEFFYGHQPPFFEAFPPLF